MAPERTAPTGSGFDLAVVGTGPYADSSRKFSDRDTV